MRKIVPELPKDYLDRRNDILAKENKQRTGGTLQLTPDEVKVNAILMQEKRKEIEESRVTGSIFPPTANFLGSKPSYEKSKVFQIIRKMAKGASLHLHEISVPSIDWIVTNLTYQPNCYMCTDTEGTLLFRFFKSPPIKSEYQWELVSEVRKRSGNVVSFDKRIYASLRFSAENADTVYATNHNAWIKFSKIFKSACGLLTFAGTLKETMYEVLKQAYDDNLVYLEIRGPEPAYDLEGNILDLESVLKIYKEVVAEFQKSFPDFLGVKYIISGHRTSSNAEMRNLVNEVLHLRKIYPDDIAGFDISDNEDKGRPTVDFVKDLLYPSTFSPSVDLPYYLHAGETDWTGTQVDDDLLDAILLNTKRIGHGFALHGHPEFLRLVRENDIAIEVNPISNQVLKLIHDLRVHPAVSLFAQNYPVVISSDNPNTWGALPASHDFYAAFMALGGAQADLKFLKQLAMNSIKYSAMSEDEKTRALDIWRSRWDIFIADIVETNG